MSSYVTDKPTTVLKKSNGAAASFPLPPERRLDPSSSTAGFFQAPPKLENQFHEDTALRRVLACKIILRPQRTATWRLMAALRAVYLPSDVQSSIKPDLSRFGEDVLSQKVLKWVADAEKNTPYLRTWDTWGRRKDELVTSEGWRKLQDMGISEGMVAIPYENHFAESSRVYQFAKYHIWTGSSAYVTCPTAMTDGAARLLSNHIALPGLPANTRPVLESAYRRLTSRKPHEAWTSGQWMTERIGGSDVSQSETQATYSPETAQGDSLHGIDGSRLGPWLINGYKWFTSATDCSTTILLARTSSGGLSVFYAPMRRIASDNGFQLNGITIQRLKTKLGTRALPTAEIQLTNMQAYLLGAEGQGTREISTILNITRLHTAMTAVGLWGRGLAISRAFARVRRTRGKLLIEIPAHVHTLAKLHVEYRACMHLTFFVVTLLGISEQPLSSTPPTPKPSNLIPNSQAVPHLLRVLTPPTKALTAKHAIAGLAECMESLGGVGYLENEEMEFNIARLFRDANVLSIWEGTTDVLADDTVRVLKGKTGTQVIEALQEWVERIGYPGSDTEVGLGGESAVLWDLWTALRDDVERHGVDELRMRGRDVMWKVFDVVCGILLFKDAWSDGDTVAREVARRFLRERGKGIGDGRVDKGMDWKEAVKWDRKIVFGHDPITAPKL
ncbi:MAG: hypothetical protein M1827_003848 [Pycnora praestabilis]|nr:MAG: hypothetical protein M1827_003848 [Pycnora praestabilis]